MDREREIQRERLFFVDFLAFFTGQVTRRDLVARFGISEPAATKDLSLYGELAPGMLQYDLKQKCYVFLAGKPSFTHDVDQSLHSLAGERAIAIDASHAKRLPSWVNISIKRKMPVELVAAITRCMYRGRTMIARYSSISSGERERMLSPLALVNDGLRWHLRCFDHEKSLFQDYNLARFTAVKEGDRSNVALENDLQWKQEVILKLVPHPKADHPETIRLDYDIPGPEKCVTLRACLVGYFVRHWNIDCTDDSSGDPSAQHLFLQNKQDLIKDGVSPWAFTFKVIRLNPN